MFFIRLIHSLPIRAMGILRRLSTIITALLILIITAAYLADSYFAGGYYSAYIIRGGAGADGGLFLEFSYFAEAHPVLGFAAVVGLVALIAMVKFFLRTLSIRRLRKHFIIVNVIHLTLNIALNMMLIFIVFIVILNGMITAYVRSFTGGGEEFAAFREQIDFVAEQIKKDENLSTVALQKMMFDMEKNPGYIASLTLDEHLKLCGEVNLLMDLRGGPKSSDEHYFRNRLNYAPQNLEAMLSEIKSRAGVSWVLLPPEQSAYHMFGRDGEYNLKFVSSEGFFEAVYNKNGELLTEENDAVNMGTYNYADPVTQPQKHSTYDVLPYYEWGNTAGSKAILEARMEDDVAVIFESQEKFEDNAEARERYAYYKSLVTGAAEAGS